MKGERFMADYSDRLLRALIREMINEDRPNVASAIEAGSRRALTLGKILNTAKSLFSVDGAVALTAVGLLYEKEFTLATLNFGYENAKVTFGKIKKFYSTPGSVFTKMNAAQFYGNDTKDQNKIEYLIELRKISKDSLTAEKVLEIMTLAKQKKLLEGANVNPDSVTESDAAILAAIVKGEGIEGIFNELQFTKEDSGAFKVVDSNQSIDDLEKKAKEAENEGLYLNARIIRGIKKSIESAADGRKEQSQEEINSAYRIYMDAKDIKAGGPDEIKSATIFDNLDDIEEGVEDSYDKTLTEFVQKLKKRGDNSLKYITDFVTNRALKQLRGEAETGNNASSSSTTRSSSTTNTPSGGNPSPGFLPSPTPGGSVPSPP